jgi:hypothetical protein
MPTKSKTYKIGGSNFGYVEQFNYPLSPCYKNTVKAGWHSGGGSCGRRPVETLTNEVDSEMYGGGFFDFFLSDEKETKKKSKSTKSTKSAKSSEPESKKKKSTSATKKKKPSKK